MSLIRGYETVIGLEVHAELKTKTKIFCSCSTRFGAPPNTQVCPVCLGLPGTLPVLNRQAVELAVRAGVGLECKISPSSSFERKNYFYPDLPKAYQISPLTSPICYDGRIYVAGEDGEKRAVGVERIQIEEDAGKLFHEGGDTLIDHNRCGVPLIEIVSRPDIRSASEALEYLKRLRTILLFAGVSDCKMNEGSLRCDVNISVRRRGEPLGTRCELKNLNSFKFIEKAIDYEARRQIDIIESGGRVECETRRFDEDSRATYPMRKKESLSDYRFFAEPDLPVIRLCRSDIEDIVSRIPPSADERGRMYRESFGLSGSDVEVLLKEVSVADFFEEAAKGTEYPKIAAGLITSVIMGLIQPDERMDQKMEPHHLSAVAQMMGEGRINSQTAKRLAGELLEGDFDPEERAEREGLFRISDPERIRAFARVAIEKSEKAVADYRKGKAAAVKSIIGKAMGESRGRADPELIARAVEEMLAGDE